MGGARVCVRIYRPNAIFSELGESSAASPRRHRRRLAAVDPAATAYVRSRNGNLLSAEQVKAFTRELPGLLPGSDVSPAAAAAATSVKRISFEDS